MRCALVMLLFLATVAFGQPLQGPFAILNPSVWNGISQPQITLRNADTADVFYEVADSIFHATVLLQNGEIVAGPELIFQDLNAYSLTLCGAVWAGNEWAALVYDIPVDWNGTYLFRGRDTLRSDTLIDQGSSEPSQWFPMSLSISPTISSRIGGGFVLGWIDDWTAWQQSFFESGWDLYALDFPPGQDGVRYVTPYIAGYDALLLQSITPDSVLAFCGLNHTIFTQVAIPLLNYGLETGCMASLAGALRTHHGSTVVLSKSADDYYEHFAARVLESTDGTCTVRQVLTSDPRAAASHPDYGMAWLAGDYRGWYLFRADTTGEQSSLPGLITQSDGLFNGGDADLTIGENGLIAALWVEESGLDSTSYSLHLASLGWETPLKAKESMFIPQPSSISLSAFPNPFNSEVRIEYSIPQSQNVELSIFNVLGQKVATLVDGKKAAGNFTALWSPAVSGGVYFVRLKSGEQTRTAKILYLR